MASVIELFPPSSFYIIPTPISLLQFWLFLAFIIMILANSYWAFPVTSRCDAGCFTYITLFNSYIGLSKSVLLFPFYRGEAEFNEVTWKG